MSDQTPLNPPQVPHLPEPEPVWTYRGYQLRASDFTTAMIHLFRAEITRANVWRQRLDTTTNWAVVATGAAISIAFSSELSITHAIIILNTLLVTLFLFIEARRYRYYELWSYRVRLMETDFFAAMLVPPFKPDANWAESLAANLLQPRFPISLWEAVGRRLRRNYVWIYLVLTGVWLINIWTHPIRTHSWQEFFQRASMGPVPGQIVLAIGLLVNGMLIAFGLLTQNLRQSAGEILPRYSAGKEEPESIFDLSDEIQTVRSWFRRNTKNEQMMAFIVTDQWSEIADRVLKTIKRAATHLSGTGMDTGQPHGVLMCALNITEVPQLKTIVQDIDPNSFVVITNAREVMGPHYAPMAA